MKKDTKKFCNQFKCWWNDKTQCTQQKIIGKNNQCINFETSPKEREN